MPQTQSAIPPMGFGDAIRTCFSKYVMFDGRARRAEYWYWVLFTLVLQFGVVFAFAFTGHLGAGQSLSSLVSVVLLLPGLAVLIRRLHDTDHSGWWWLISFTGIGLLVLLYWVCLEGTKGPNRFGPPTT